LLHIIDEKTDSEGILKAQILKIFMKYRQTQKQKIIFINYSLLSMEDNKKLKKYSEFEEILEKINEHIFNGQLTDIIEVTYAYKKMSDGNYWNETLF
jgi:hypothetical protein